MADYMLWKVFQFSTHLSTGTQIQSLVLVGNAQHQVTNSLHLGDSRIRFANSLVQ